MKRLFTAIGLSIMMLVTAVGHAQILVAGEGQVVYGHHHLNVTNIDASYHVLLTVRALNETPASIHHFLPTVTLGRELDRFLHRLVVRP